MLFFSFLYLNILTTVENIKYKIFNRKEELVGKKALVVFCRSGNRSSKALSILKEHGHENVINGGSWQNVKKVQEENDN